MRRKSKSRYGQNQLQYHVHLSSLHVHGPFPPQHIPRDLRWGTHL